MISGKGSSCRAKGKKEEAGEGGEREAWRISSLALGDEVFIFFSPQKAQEDAVSVDFARWKIFEVFHGGMNAGRPALISSLG